MKLYILESGYGAASPFDDMVDVIAINRWHPSIKKGDIIMYDGGSDVCPELYGHPINPYCGPTDGERDAREKGIFGRGMKIGTKFLGICRGSQLLCALSGGSLIQHANGHGGSHDITTDTGETLEVSSTHHQMMYPFDVKHKIIAHSSHKLSRCHLMREGADVQVPLEPEAVWFPETQALAIQWHPEFMPKNSECVKYSRELVKKYLIGEANESNITA